MWATLIDPAKIARWMGGAHVESTWQPGSPISFAGSLHGNPYQDSGTVLACEPERLLRYNHWSVLSRRDDSEHTRTVITFSLTPEGAETRLDVRHDNLAGRAAFGHARLFWNNALNTLRDIAEER